MNSIYDSLQNNAFRNDDISVPSDEDACPTMEMRRRSGESKVEDNNANEPFLISSKLLNVATPDTSLDTDWNSSCVSYCYERPKGFAESSFIVDPVNSDFVCDLSCIEKADDDDSVLSLVSTYELMRDLSMETMQKNINENDETLIDGDFEISRLSSDFGVKKNDFSDKIPVGSSVEEIIKLNEFVARFSI